MRVVSVNKTKSVYHQKVLKTIDSKLNSILRKIAIQDSSNNPPITMQTLRNSA